MFEWLNSSINNNILNNNINNDTKLSSHRQRSSIMYSLTFRADTRLPVGRQRRGSGGGCGGQHMPTARCTARLGRMSSTARCWFRRARLVPLGRS